MKTLVLAFAVLASTSAFAAAKTAPAAAAKTTVKAPHTPAAVKTWINTYGDGNVVFSGKTKGGELKWWVPADANTATLYTKGDKIVRVVGQ